MDFKLLNDLLLVKTERVEEIIIDYLNEYGYNYKVEPNLYIVAEGRDPIGFVVHLDTVWDNCVKDLKITNNWIFSANSSVGIGADDRLGIFILLRMLDLYPDFRPYIFFCYHEEIGGIGAQALAAYEWEYGEILDYIIELDRCGTSEAVFYDCENKIFQKMITDHGWMLGKGTWSDISFIAPVWDVAAVNLSTGYWFEHSPKESIELKAIPVIMEKIYNLYSNTKDAQRTYSFRESKVEPYFFIEEGEEI